LVRCRARIREELTDLARFPLPPISNRLWGIDAPETRQSCAVSAGMAYAFTRFSGDYVEQEKAAIGFDPGTLPFR
jgi:hypothetical protein